MHVLSSTVTIQIAVKFDYVSVSYLVLYFENYRYNLDIVIAW